MASSATERTPLLAEETPGVAPPLIESDSTDEVATRTVPNGTDTENGASAKPQVSLAAVVSVATSMYDSASVAGSFRLFLREGWRPPVNGSSVTMR